MVGFLCFVLFFAPVIAAAAVLVVRSRNLRGNGIW